MYHIVAYFDVPPERHQQFIDAALKDGRDSSDTEPGTKRFELISDEDNRNRFYLNEAYADEEAFCVHKGGASFKQFFDVIGIFAWGPTVILKGAQIPDTRRHARVSGSISSTTSST
jgi:autoinducer 2-degrading protein